MELEEADKLLSDSGGESNSVPQNNHRQAAFDSVNHDSGV